ncbi:MAG: hypothetical protein SGPRY_001325 [Prymnesium sp.]
MVSTEPKDLRAKQWTEHVYASRGLTWSEAKGLCERVPSDRAYLAKDTSLLRRALRIDPMTQKSLVQLWCVEHCGAWVAGGGEQMHSMRAFHGISTRAHHEHSPSMLINSSLINELTISNHDTIKIAGKHAIAPAVRRANAPTWRPRRVGAGRALTLASSARACLNVSQASAQSAPNAADVCFDHEVLSDRISHAFCGRWRGFWALEGSDVQYPNQCEFCKCRACSMCKHCSSGIEGDAVFESCEDWCSVREHCDHCKCRACSVCQSCSPADENDIEYKDCQSWCSGEDHCKQCKCKGCPTCQAQCAPHNHDDDNFISCQSWCHTESYHCPFCKCKACPLCKDRCMEWCSTASDCTSKSCQGCSICERSEAVIADTCEPWCRKANCRKSSCVGCRFCEELGETVACSSGLSNDVEYEECASFKLNGKRSSKLPCACSCADTALAVAAHSAPHRLVHLRLLQTRACPAHLLRLRTRQLCVAHLDIHCDLCKCKACNFCPIRLDTGISCPAPTSNDDSKTIKCEPFCAMAHAEAHCSMCKCSGCSFCKEAAGKADNATAALLKRLPATRSRTVSGPLSSPSPLPTPAIANGDARQQLTVSIRHCPWVESVAWEGKGQTRALRLSLTKWPDQGGKLVVAPTISRESEGRLRFDAASPSATGTLVVQPAASISVGSEWLTSLSESQARAVVLDSLESEEGETQTLSIRQELMSSYRSLLLSATNGVALASAVRWGVVDRTPSIILVAAKQPLREPIALACSDSTPATPADFGSPPQPTFSPPRAESSEKSGLLDIDVKLDYYEPKPGWVATGDEDGGGAGAVPASEAGMGRNLILTLGVAAGLMLAAGMMRLRQVRLEMDPTH